MKKHLYLSITLMSLAMQMQAQTYYYDRKSQLTGINYGDYAIAYTYDKLGNRITVEQGEGVVLNMNFAGFTGAVSDCQAQLSWQVVTEERVKAYIIERSMDGIAFQAIDSVQAAGSRTYNFTDAHTPKGNLFYRVIMEMNNADKSYSSVLKLINSCATLNLVKIFPNPATETLNLTFTSSVSGMPVQFVIVDAKGRPVLSASFSTAGVGENHRFDISSLAAGTYFCRLLIEGKIEAEEKVVIVR